MTTEPLQVVAMILRLKDGRVLVGQRRQGDTSAGKWEFPGGKVKIGETDEQALRREIVEELGFTIPTFRFFDEVSYPYPNSMVHIRFYLCEVEKEVKLEKFSHDDLQWIDPKNHQFDFLEANRSVIEKLTKFK